MATSSSEKPGGPADLRSKFAGQKNFEIVSWSLVVAAMLLDVALTYYGLHQGLTELNPVATLAIDTYGYGSLFALKILAVLVAWNLMGQLPEKERVLVPLALALPWISAVIVNIHWVT